MRLIGKILIALQIVAVIGSLINGSLPLPTSIYGLGEFIGFCLPGIIGYFLIRRANRRGRV